MGKMNVLVKTQNLKVGYARRQLWVVFYGNPHIFSHPVDAAAFFFRQYVRPFFPSFWAVGMFCCDTHRVNFRPEFTWTDKAMHYAKDWGDGPDTWTRISFKEWRGLRNYRRGAQ